ncbi:MAG: WD40 repeat domain-containing serine/threonine protein kinase [Acidobacteriota bacterium]
MKICPWCEAGYSDELTSCPIHGGLLSEIRDLKPGMLVRNTYRIVRKLSHGGMGNVYLAQHILLNEPQVLKFLSAELSRDHDWTSRFLREVRTLRQIRHKNVVYAGNLEAAEDGALFFSMEYVDGPDLMEFYRRAPKPFDVRLVLELVRGVAEGLGAAHAAGVVHRDIKPENILIAREGDALVPKIADFGIVATKGSSRLTQSGTTLMTPQFAAPEQWLGVPTAELDGRADLYALGGLMFEILTGRCAFAGENYNAWAQQHLHTPAPAPSSLRPELKCWRGLDELVLRLLAKDRDDRPRDTAEFLRLLDAIVYVEPASAGQAAPGQQAGVLALEPEAPAPEPLAPEDAPPGPAAVAVPTRTRHRTRIGNLPMPVWEPMQPRPSKRPRTYIREPDLLLPEPARVPRRLLWIVAVVAFLGVGFAAWRVLSNPVSSTVLTSRHGPVFALAFSPDGLSLASAIRQDTVQFWNVADGRPLGAIPAAVSCLAYSPDGHTLATGMADYSINLWDTSRSVVLGTLVGHTGRVAALAFSPDGHTLASASWDGTVRLWDVASDQLLRTLDGSNSRILTAAFSPDGRSLATAGADGFVRLWNPASGTLLQTLAGHTGPVNAVAFSPGGHTLASAGDDRTLRLWDLSAAPAARVFRGHTGAVFSVAFSPDGRSLASGSADATVRLWSVNSGGLVRVLKDRAGPVLSVAFSPYGYIVASAGSDNTIRLWGIAGLRE